MQRCTRRIGLSPLSAAAVEVMAAGSSLDAAELYRVTGGNSFYVAEALQAGLDQVPPSARDAVLARAARLGPRAREILQAGVPALADLPALLDIAARAERDTAGYDDLLRLLRAGSSLGGARPKAHVLDAAGRVAIAKFPQRHLGHLERDGVGEGGP